MIPVQDSACIVRRSEIGWCFSAQRCATLENPESGTTEIAGAEMEMK
jgi:hypothetical protein